MMSLMKMNEYVATQEKICEKNDYIAPRLYDEYGVNRGLRDDRGVGVLTGLTNISKIVSSKGDSADNKLLRKQSELV